MPYLTTKGDGYVYLTLHVQPRSSRAGLCGLHGGALKVAITAPPVDGKANKEVVAFLAALLGIPKKEVVIVGGELSRSKRCRIGSLSEQEIRKRIAATIGGNGC